MKRVSPKYYTKKYYLTDATGHEYYLKYYGKRLDRRFEEVVRHIPMMDGDKVLDIGCGRGELSYWLARNGAAKVVAVDYSENAIKLSRRAWKKWPAGVKNKVSFKWLDAKDIDKLKTKFDLVIMTEVLEHLHEYEQKLILKKIANVISKEGKVYIHTAPSKHFTDFTYKFWCYPISWVLVTFSNLFTNSKYPHIEQPYLLRKDSHRIMHVNEPTYFSLVKLFSSTGFEGSIYSTNITVKKPIYSWKDALFNFFVYLVPFSKYPPFNIVWANDYWAVLQKK